ncbi:MAG: acyl-CoA thioesterase [Hyphomicrobiales bacterium]|nr:acyl-CoA thioesterase [Hyphomicrobiales bacterium]
MFSNRRDVTIEWGDCDPAGIVFYPRYFAMFDASTAFLFAAAGFPKQDLRRRFDFIGWPMVDTRARFLIPSAFGDIISIESRVVAWKRSSFDLEHRVFKREALAIEGFETRVWTGPHPEQPGRLKSRPVPEEIIARFNKA